MHLGEPVGRTTCPFGLDHVRANLSAQQVKALGLMMSGTYGRTGTTSSASAALSECLSNRLRAETASVGSILYRLTWKQRVTPLQRPISALRGSPWGKGGKATNGYNGPFCLVPIPWLPNSCAILPVGLAQTLATAATICDNGYTATLSGWPSPTVGNATGGQTPPEGTSASGLTPDGRKVTVALPAVAQLAAWPTPRTADSQGGVEPAGQTGRKLFTIASLAGWPTPMAGTPARNGNNEAGNTDSSRRTVALVSGWHTPLARDGDKLDATPQAIEKRQQDGREIGTAMEARMCSDHGWTTHPGPMRVSVNGSCATIQTDHGGGRLNPAHSRWLMRLPPEWDGCAPMETASTLKRQRDSWKR